MVRFSPVAKCTGAPTIVRKRREKSDATPRISGRRVLLELHGAFRSWVIPKCFKGKSAALKRLAEHCCHGSPLEATDVSMAARSIEQLCLHLFACGATEVVAILEGDLEAKRSTHDERRAKMMKAFAAGNFTEAVAVPDCFVRAAAEVIATITRCTVLCVPGEAEATAAACLRANPLTDIYLNYSGDWDVLLYDRRGEVLFMPSISGVGGARPRVSGTLVDLGSLCRTLTLHKALYDTTLWGNPRAAFIAVGTIMGGDFCRGIRNMGVSRALQVVDRLAGSALGRGCPMDFFQSVALRVCTLKETAVASIDFVAACAAVYFAPVREGDGATTYTSLCTCGSPSAPAARHAPDCCHSKVATYVAVALWRSGRPGHYTQFAVKVFRELLSVYDGKWHPVDAATAYNHFGCHGTCFDKAEMVACDISSEIVRNIPPLKSFDKADWTQLVAVPYAMAMRYMQEKTNSKLATKRAREGWSNLCDARQAIVKSFHVCYHNVDRTVYVRMWTPQSQWRGGYWVVVILKMASAAMNEVEAIEYVSCECVRCLGYVLCAHRATALVTLAHGTARGFIGRGTTDRPDYTEPTEELEGKQRAMLLSHCVPNHSVKLDEGVSTIQRKHRAHALTATHARMKSARDIAKTRMVFDYEPLKKLERLYDYHTCLTRKRDLEADPEFDGQSELRGWRGVSPRHVAEYDESAKPHPNPPRVPKKSRKGGDRD